MPKFRVNDHIVYPFDEDRLYDQSSWVFEKGEEFIVTKIDNFNYILKCIKCSGTTQDGITAKTYNIDPYCHLVGGISKIAAPSTYFPNLSNV